jgi:hypothetical protein
LLLLVVYLIAATAIYVYRFIKKHGFQHLLRLFMIALTSPSSSSSPSSVMPSSTGVGERGMRDDIVEYELCGQGEGDGSRHDITSSTSNVLHLQDIPLEFEKDT